MRAYFSGVMDSLTKDSKMTSESINELLNKQCADFIDECPHCGARAHLVLVSNEHHSAKSRDQYNYVIFRCKPCKKLTLKVFHSKQNPYDEKQNLEISGWVAQYPNGNTYAQEKFVEFVPKAAISDYEEGLRCLSVNSPRAAVGMFRRSLQDALIQLGADQQAELIDQIKIIPKLTDEIKDWAHNIRIFGNWGAHPQKDLLKNVDMEKANEVKDFTDEFFNYVYVMPGKVAAARKIYEKSEKKSRP